MSGRKTTYTSISVDELNRLRRQAATASSLAQSSQALAQLDRRTEQYMRQQQGRVDELNGSIRNLSRTMERRAAADSKERQQLRERLNAVISDTNEALVQASEQNQRSVADLRRDVQDDLTRRDCEIARMIDASSRRLDQALARTSRAIESQIDAVGARIDGMERQVMETANSVGALYDSDSMLLNLAREYAEAARILNEDTASSFRADLLLPGRLAQSQALLRDAEAHIADAAGDLLTNAAVARERARAAVEAALQLHEAVILAEQEWQARHYEARQAVCAALAQVEACRQVEYPGAGVSVEIDVDLWSNGDLEALRGRAESYQELLDDPDSLTAEDLVGLRDAGSQVAREVTEAVEFAVIAASASQDRADIAQDVADHMREALGLEILSHGYQGGDRRGAHRIHLKNPVTGFEMVVTQYPEADENAMLGNRLESDILDYGTNNEQHGDDIARQALSALSGLGLCQSPVRTEAGYESRPSERRELAEMGRWSEEVPAYLPGPNHALMADESVRSATSVRIAR